jgi:hypothetical protein
MSGGAPSNTTSQTTTELPKWAQGYATQLLDRGAALSQQNMPVYTGQRSADLNATQQQGMNMATNRATNGSAEINTGSAALQGTLNGQYLNRSTGTNQFQGAQPTGSNAYQGAAPSTTNQFQGAQPNGTNAFMGDNPYLQSTIDKAAGDITRNYTGAVNATDSTMARSGAFGGSAWQAAQQGNAHELATGLADSASGIRMQNYAQSANLAESALARDQSSWQTNANMADTTLARNQANWNTNANMSESALGRDQANWQTNAGLAENGLNRNQTAFQAERANQMNGLPLALQYGNQAYTDAAALQGVGDTQYGATQQQLNDRQNLFNEQAAAPYKSLDVLGNSIRGAVGGGSTVSTSAPGASVAGQAAGGAAALYSLFGK